MISGMTDIDGSSVGNPTVAESSRSARYAAMSSAPIVPDFASEGMALSSENVPVPAASRQTFPSTRPLELSFNISKPEPFNRSGNDWEPGMTSGIERQNRNAIISLVTYFIRQFLLYSDRSIILKNIKERAVGLGVVEAAASPYIGNSSKNMILLPLLS